MRILLFISLIACFFTNLINAQIQTSSPNLRDTPTQVGEQDARVDAVISKAETYFREGEVNIRDGERNKAREKFDQAVDTILMSGLRVRSFPKLKKYYAELVERIYRLDVPNQVPQSHIGQQNSTTTKTGKPQIEFAEQKFEPSPLDELAKLDLSEQFRGNSAAAQQNCVKIESPVVQDLRLGTTFDFIKTNTNFNFTKARLKNENFGSKVYYFSNPRKNVDFLALGFYNNKLYLIGVIYGNEINWKNLVEFKDYAANALNLPLSWNLEKNYSNYKLTCKNFVIIASNYRYIQKSIFVSDNKAMEEIAKKEAALIEARKAAERKQKETFKP